MYYTKIYLNSSAADLHSDLMPMTQFEHHVSGVFHEQKEAFSIGLQQRTRLYNMNRDPPVSRVKKISQPL